MGPCGCDSPTLSHSSNISSSLPPLRLASTQTLPLSPCPPLPLPAGYGQNILPLAPPPWQVMWSTVVARATRCFSSWRAVCGVGTTGGKRRLACRELRWEHILLAESSGASSLIGRLVQCSGNVGSTIDVVYRIGCVNLYPNSCGILAGKFLETRYTSIHTCSHLHFRCSATSTALRRACCAS